MPEIRFRDFVGPWDLRQFSDLYRLTSEKNDMTFGRDRIISVANMFFNPAVSVTEDSYLMTYNVMRTGDIAFEGHSSDRYAHGRFVENTIGDGIVSHIFKVFRPIGDEFDLSYWKHAINNERLMKDVLTRSTKASTMMHELVADDFLEESILVPTVLEQQTIGSFIDILDSLIDLQQRKHDELLQTKGAMLNKMFPKPGETVPEIRFKGFADSWEHRKLGDCGSTYGGLFGKTKDDFGHGDAHFVPYTNVFDNAVTDIHRLETVERDTRQNTVRRGDVFFTVSSETPEEVGMSSVWLSDQRDVYLNSFCFGFRQDGSFDPYYLAYMLRSTSVRADLTLLAQGISRFNISKNKVMELAVSVPSLEEQKEIGTFFRNLDSLIDLHRRKLELLKRLKSAFLDKMFA